MGLYNDILSEFIKTGLKQQEDLFKKALIENSVPPIKGEITANKCKWRGIKINYYMATGEQCITQRGVEISPRFKFTINLSDYGI